MLVIKPAVGLPLESWSIGTAHPATLLSQNWPPAAVPIVVPAGGPTHIPPMKEPLRKDYGRIVVLVFLAVKKLVAMPSSQNAMIAIPATDCLFVLPSVISTLWFLTGAALPGFLPLSYLYNSTSDSLTDSLFLETKPMMPASVLALTNG